MDDKKLVDEFNCKLLDFTGINAEGAAIRRYGKLVSTLFGGIGNAIGIEVEVEKSTPRLADMVEDSIYWNHTQDGSLKDAGLELISSPLRNHNIDYALYELSTFYAAHKNFKVPLSFSRRCGIHIHCNVSTLTRKQLHYFVALYAALEPLYWVLPEKHRQQNSFCVPLIDISPDSINMDDHLNKYCAFNIHPIGRQMTVEFRHLHSTDNLLTMKRWIQLIAKLHKYVETNSGDIPDTIMNLSKKEACPEIIQSIYGKTAKLFDGFDYSKLLPGIFWANLYLVERTN